jgi:hypothetical protein
MDWQRILDWFDNPILVKHLRSRLRIQPLIASIVVVQALCLCIVWGGYQLDDFSSGRAFGWLLSLQAIVLAIMGAGQVGSAVGAARASGILDFHRVSPVSPAALTLGFFFGAPIREYVLFATTLPFSALCLAFGAPTVHGFIQLMILLLGASWLLHGISLLSALLAKPRSGSKGVVGVVVFVLIFGGYAMVGISRSASLVDYDLRLSLYGVSLPWLTVVLIYLSALLQFIYLACNRRMASERIHAFSKPQAMAAMTTLSVLLLGGIWKRDEYDVLAVIALYVLVAVAMVLVAMVTPSQAEYSKGLWRAKKQGKSLLPPWDDLALNWAFLALVCTTVLVTATIVWQARPEGPNMDRVTTAPPHSYSLGIACGVVVVAYFGLALQFFLLWSGARGPMYFGLFLFLAWILPLVAGTIVEMSRGGGRDPGAVVFALSPIPGIGLTAAGAWNEAFTKAVQAATITPALLFTFVFNSLLIGARRRRHRAFLLASGGTQGSKLPVEGEGPRP